MNASSESESGSVVDQLVNRNIEYSKYQHVGGAPSAPALGVAIVTCMDARLDVLKMLGIGSGDAHILRNAGGIVTDGVIKSLCMSQRHLGTTAIMLIHHTACGMLGVDEEALREELQLEFGVKPTWSLESFADAHDDVAQSIRRLENAQFLTHKDSIRGFVFDVETGLLEEVLAG